MTSRTHHIALAPIIALTVLAVSGCAVVHDVTQDVLREGEKELASDRGTR